MVSATWKPHTEHGELDTDDRKELPDSVYAFPEQRKEPLTDASHVRNALARFDQVKGVSDADRDLAFALVVDAELFRLDSVVRWLDAADGRIKRAAADSQTPALARLPKAPKTVGVRP